MQIKNAKKSNLHSLGSFLDISALHVKCLDISALTLVPIFVCKALMSSHCHRSGSFVVNRSLRKNAVSEKEYTNLSVSEKECKFLN